MATPVDITVKSPFSRDNEDKVLNARLEWSVLDLKLKIQSLWDSHPDPKHQKLIYGGKLLSDDSILKDVIRLEDGIRNYTLHLICRDDHSSQTTTATHSGRNSPPERRTAMNNEDMNVRLRHRSMGFSQHSEQGQTLHHQQAYWMQHMYSHYMNHYMQYLSNQHSSFAGESTFSPVYGTQPTSSSEVLAPRSIPEGAHQARPPIGPEVPVAAPAAAPPGPPEAPVAVNGAAAFGGRDDDEDFEGNGRRDALDWFYVFCRVLVLFSLVSLYSSFTRFAMVTAMAFVLYMYQTGWFHNFSRGQLQIREQRRRLRRRGSEERENDRAGSEEEHSDAAATTTTVVSNSSTNNPGERNRSGFCALAVTFITSLFTSLLPDQNQLI